MNGFGNATGPKGLRSPWDRSTLLRDKSTGRQSTSAVLRYARHRRHYSPTHPVDNSGRSAAPGLAFLAFHTKAKVKGLVRFAHRHQGKAEEPTTLFLLSVRLKT